MQKETGLPSLNYNQINSWHNTTPVWEQKFISDVESMRTVPYISLMHFNFVLVKFVEKRKKNRSKSPKSGLNFKTINRELEQNSGLLFSSIDSGEELNETDEAVNKKKNTLFFWLKEYHLSKQKLSDQIKDLKQETLNKEVDKGQSMFNKINEDFNSFNAQSIAFQLFRLNNSLHDYKDAQRKKRLKRIKQVMEQDENEFDFDYKSLLGIEFWSSFCGIEKREIRNALPNVSWPETLFELSRTLIEKKLERIRENEFSLPQKLLQGLVEIKRFFKGPQKPQRPPRRMITPEERFRVVPAIRLQNPNSDLKRITEYKSLKDKVYKQLKRFYIRYIYWAVEKPERQISVEEALEDLLIWMLDEDQAKTRFIALLKDHIKKDIN